MSPFYKKKKKNPIIFTCSGNLTHLLDFGLVGHEPTTIALKINREQRIYFCSILNNTSNKGTRIILNKLSYTIELLEEIKYFLSDSENNS